jgi:hypothetical protein
MHNRHLQESAAPVGACLNIFNYVVRREVPTVAVGVPPVWQNGLILAKVFGMPF